jgi:uncharacterized protein (DUF1778 family)
MGKEQQTERVGLRLTPSEVRMLAAVSEATGQTMTNVVRQAIRREYSERFGKPLTPRAKRTKQQQ